MSEQSIILEFAFGANSLINEVAKNAIEVAIKSDLFKNSLALKIPGIQFTVVGNVDKGVKILTAWDNGNGSDDAVGKAVFESITGVLGGIGGGLAGRFFANWPSLATIGAQWWLPPVGAWGGDKTGEYAGGLMWDALPASTKTGSTSSPINMLGLDLQFRSYKPAGNTFTAANLSSTNELFVMHKTDSGNYDIYAATSNQSTNIITGERLVRDPDVLNGNYTVQKGDTLWGLSIKYGLTVDQIKEANPQITNSKSWVWEGQKINLPVVQTTNTFTHAINPTLATEVCFPDDPTTAVSEDNSTLIDNGTCQVLGLGNVNTATGNQQAANAILSDNWMPGANQVLDSDLWANVQENYLDQAAYDYSGS